ncbi:hypothetical protein F4809DRAFT_88530 [Biscogniauxia mediterranea]|nr:hypothetical protein F4809DRAFT_88530 [Biscogniauxia mediterranea]
MYDDYDHRSRDERDYYRRRSPTSRDHQYRSRHGKDSSRSPRRTPPRGPRGEDSYRGRRHQSPYRRDPSSSHRHGASARDTYARDRDDYAAIDSTRKESPDRAHGRYYSQYDDRRGRYNRSPRRAGSRGSSPADSADEGSYHGSGHRPGPGRPYHTLKLDDIPDWMSTREVDNAMRDMGADGLVEVRIKSDDRSGSRRCYAFAEFRSDDDAMDFLERHYPALDINGANGSPIRIYLEYSRERRQVANPDDWKCTMCHFENFSRRATCKQCKAPRSTERTGDMKLDGKSDECPQQTPSQFIVIRGLPSSVTETVLAAEVKKLYVNKDGEPKQTAAAPGKLKSTAPIGNTSGLGAKPGSLVRVFMIRDRYSDISCNYGFAEFSTLDDARAAMAKYNASPQFTIASKPVTIAFIHSGVFTPYMHPLQEHDHKFTFSATHNPSLRLVYWNPSVYASESLIFNESLYEDSQDKQHDAGQAKKDANQASGKDTKKRKADKELTAPTGKKVIAMAPQLQMWANKHAELHGPKELGGDTTAGDDKIPVTGSNAIGPAVPSVPNSSSAPSVSYADLDQMCCLLCRRKFGNEPSLRRHEQISDMHKSNLENESLINKAIKDLKALGKEPTSNYRDRAKERRMAHNQPSKPKPHLPRKNAPVPKEPEEAKEAPTKATISKGAGLLAKMGWSSGEGLGAEGSGRTSVIETTAYTPGVGLGAEGGKIGDAVEEAARATKNDYADFVSKAKDKARERYERMG